MARLTLSQLAISLHGRQDGVTVRMTRHGPVMQKAQDTPPRTDVGSVASKSRFAAAVHAWSVMPATLLNLLHAAHACKGHGSPGPWIKAWSGYGLLGTWTYPFASDSSHSLAIDYIDVAGPDWNIWFTAAQPSPWVRCRVLVFHPKGGLGVNHWMWYPLSANDWMVHVPVESMPAGSSALVLPCTIDASEVALGDAALLP